MKSIIKSVYECIQSLFRSNVIITHLTTCRFFIICFIIWKECVKEKVHLLLNGNVKCSMMMIFRKCISWHMFLCSIRFYLDDLQIEKADKCKLFCYITFAFNLDLLITATKMCYRDFYVYWMIIDLLINSNCGLSEQKCDVKYNLCNHTIM